MSCECNDCNCGQQQTQESGPRQKTGQDKEVEPDDPFSLKGVGFAGGDREHMIACLIEEYARLGWNEERLMRLFTTPNFQIPHQYYQQQGEEAVREKIQEVLDRHGVYQYDVQRKEGESNG